MKASLTISAVILAVAGVIGWQNHGKLDDARLVRARLSEEARAIGLDAEELLKNGSSPRRMKNTREGDEDEQAHAKKFARTLADFANEMKKMQQSGTEPDSAMQKRIFEIIGEMVELDAAQLKTLVAELQAMPDVDEEMRRGIIGFAIMTMAESHPAGALAMATESAGALGKNGPGQHVVSTALAKWSEDNPKAALEWVKANAKDHPDMVTDHSKQGILTGVARTDPRLAFQMIADLELKDAGEAGGKIIQAAKTPAERSAALAALREHVKGLSDAKAGEALVDSSLRSLGQAVQKDGYDASAAWIESAKLTPKETESMVDGMGWWQVKEDTGKWIDWMHGKLPEERFKPKVAEMIGNWTKQDYKAAGEWINASKDGPVRQAAAQAYAVTVAPYEPDSAAQWAESLPPGKDRDEAFKTIYSQWKQKDENAAAEFARKHGLGD